MSEVVQLDPASRAKKSRSRRRRRSKTALVLGGGGFTGGVYEIGALRALDLLAVNRTVNDFDVYVGTSAGSFVASVVANGVTPEEMMRVLNKHLPSPLRDIDLGTLLRPNYRGFVSAGAEAPAARGRGRPGARQARWPRCRPWTSPRAWPPGCPKGLYTGAGIEQYVAEVLSDPDRTNDFRLLEHELYLTATDLDTTERIVLGEGEWADVPISPCGRRLDGAADRLRAGRDQGPRDHRRRHPLDHERRHRGRAGRQVHRRHQPARPVRQRLHASASRRSSAAACARVSDMGFVAIANQAFRLIAHDRLHRAVEEWEYAIRASTSS